VVDPRGFVELQPGGRGERLVGGRVQAARALKVGFQGPAIAKKVCWVIE
jgi:hypothetical protein